MANPSLLTLKFLVDENFDQQIVRGLLLVRELDVATVLGVGLGGESDPVELSWAADNNRILLTHDVTTMTKHAYDRVESGLRMPGVFEVSRKVPIRSAIDDLLLIAECSRQGDWEGQVLYLPLRRRRDGRRRFIANSSVLKPAMRSTAF